MAEYIERADVMKICQEYSSHCFVSNDASGQDIADRIEDDIVKLPTADVVEVKHGYNKTSMHPVDEFLCSECGFCCADYTETKYDEDGDYTYSCECEFDYCPRCGAKMDGGS